MFSIGPIELLVLLLVPGSGLVAAAYLAFALNRNSGRGNRTP
jgi:hypothetical protein